MICDETYPAELDEIESLYNIIANGDTLTSTGTFETSVNSSEACASATDISGIPQTWDENDYFETTGSSFVSLESTKKLTFAHPLPAPCKQKKSFSCQDLLQKKINYEHIESKVKKLIENDSKQHRQKVLSRHKSMPVSTQPLLDETYSEVKDPSIFTQELRKKAIQIYELQEQNEEKDARIYALEYEKSKMRMTFDKVRVEMHELKEKERHYGQLTTSPSKILKNASSQTDDLKLTTFSQSYQQNARNISDLTLGNETTTFLDHTHFSELNNASSDNLIPEVVLENVNNITITVDQQLTSEDRDEERKKKKKFQRFLKLMSCVSK